MIDLNYLVDESCQVYQHKEHFKMNTDTRLLATFVKVHKMDTILDIGTNNGALLLYMDRFDVKKLIGVEILEEPLKIAQMNAKAFLQHDYELIHANIKDVNIPQVDLIISNPPYFKSSETNANIKMTLRQYGRVEENLTLHDLVENTYRLLKDKGRFCMVHRPDRLNEIYKELLDHHFSIKTMQIAYDKNSEQEKSICIEAIKNSNCKCKILPPKWI